MTTFAEIEDAFKGSVGFEALVGAASQMGGPQVRNRATIGGNIADASPACDAGPVLLAMNASVKAVSVHGQRSIPVSDFFLGVRKTALAPDELMEKVTIPETPTLTAWRKVSLRMASAISVLSMAACRFSDGRLFLAAGAVAPRPVRLQNCEKCIEKGDLSAQRLKEALYADICPIDDIRADADYRRNVAENLLIDLLQKEFGYEIG